MDQWDHRVGVGQTTSVGWWGRVLWAQIVNVDVGPIWAEGRIVKRGRVDGVV